jgi:arylsulfatase A-like enzyme
MAMLTTCVTTRAATTGQGGRADESTAAVSRPNVVIIYTDDQGYADWGPAARAQGFATPNLERMASEGVVSRDFYVAQGVCSPSRAALLTGSYPNRIGIGDALDQNSRVALNPSEVTIASMLKQRGYATALVGKWHLGSDPKHLPLSYGFDEFFGLPYSHDMRPGHPLTPDYYPPLPLYDGNKVIETNPDFSQLTTRYTEHAVNFIDRHRHSPFFLYLAQSMPHVPLAVSDKFKGKSKRGLYGDVMEEVDWSVGQVLATIKRDGLDRSTLVIFASDNGPWLPYGDRAGSTGPLRGEKGTELDGGTREPFIARWPGHIPAGRVGREPLMNIDILPTVADVTGAKVPTDRTIDGKDIWPLLSGQPGARNPHKVLYFYYGRKLEAVLSGPWKLHVPHPYLHTVSPGRDGKPGKEVTLQQPFALYNLDDDIAETWDVSAQHPEVVKRLLRHVEQARGDLGDSLTHRVGRDLRAPAKVVPKWCCRKGQVPQPKA